MVGGEETSTAAAGSNCRGAEATVVAIVGSSESRDAVVNVCSPSEDGEAVPAVEMRRPYNLK